MSFSELEKRKICSEIKNTQLTVAEASVKYNCPKSTLYSWLSIYDRSEDMTASASYYIPSTLDAFQTALLVGKVEAYGWDSEKAALECRKLNVKLADLRKFKDAAAQEGLVCGNEYNALKKEFRSSNKTIQSLKKDQSRLEKALAETSICLVELKKVQTFFTSMED